MVNGIYLGRMGRVGQQSDEKTISADAPGYRDSVVAHTKMDAISSGITGDFGNLLSVYHIRPMTSFHVWEFR